MPADPSQPTPQYGSNPFYNNPVLPSAAGGQLNGGRPPVLQPADHAEMERQHHTPSQAAADLKTLEKLFLSLA